MGIDTLPRQSGIYLIECLANGAVYVGQSVGILKRCKGHLSALEKGSHYNSRMQKCFNKHGAESFSFSVAELCDKNELNDREQFWIDSQDLSRLLNCAPVAVSPRGVKRSPETIAKRLEKMRGYQPSEKTKAKMRESHLARADITRAKTILQMQDPEMRKQAGKAMRGKRLTQEHKALVSLSSLERWQDPSYKQRLSETQKVAQKAIAKQHSEAMLLRWRDPEYRSYMAACKAAKKSQRINSEVIA